MTIALLREAGIEADGEVMDPDPYAAVMDALGEEDYDEIIISTHPETRSGWLRQGLVDRSSEPRAARWSTWSWTSTRERDDVKRTLVVANQTVDGAPAARRAQAQGRRGAAPLHRDLPAVRRQRRRRDDPHERLAHTLKELEDAGLRGHRPGGPIRTRTRRSRTRCSSTRPTTS